MVVYISGKMRGYTREQIVSKFQASEEYLIELGYSVENPANVDNYMPEDSTWVDLMLEDIKLLFSCHAIYMQADWQDSTGAKIEHDIAKHLGLKIFYESNITTNDK